MELWERTILCGILESSNCGPGRNVERKYLKNIPRQLFRLPIDFDLYEPTKRCLELIRPHLVKEQCLGFDELNDMDSPEKP
jgi:hypothetical protein